MLFEELRVINQFTPTDVPVSNICPNPTLYVCDRTESVGAPLKDEVPRVVLRDAVAEMRSVGSNG